MMFPEGPQLSMSGRWHISCAAAYNQGGLGQHLAHVVSCARDSDTLAAYYSAQPEDEDPAGHAVNDWQLPNWLNYTPLRYYPDWHNYHSSDRFDKAVSQMLNAPIDVFAGFGAQSLRSFCKARKLGAKRLILLTASSHVEHVYQQFQDCHDLYPIERSWLNLQQVDKIKKEYETADEIVVTTDYCKKTFLDRGVSESKLKRMTLPVAPRFLDGHHTPGSEFTITYTGALTACKGIPVLVSAFENLPMPARLVLVGGTWTRGMNRYLKNKLEQNNIVIVSGDPLKYLLKTSVYVHPTFEDSYAYAAAEAAALGIPLIVTENTGMKEFISADAVNQIVPTGKVDALVNALIQIYEELK